MQEQDTIQEPRARAQDDATREELLRQLRELREMSAQLEGTGKYILLPTEALARRAEGIYYRYYDEIANLLENAGIDEDTAGGVLRDYVFILSGLYKPTLSLENIARVVIAVKPWKMFFVEPYGLSLLFNLYTLISTKTADYINYFKCPSGTVERVVKRRGEDGKMTEERTLIETTLEQQRTNYLNTEIARLGAGFMGGLPAALRWLHSGTVEIDGEQQKIVETSDFVGVAPELINKYFAYVEVYTEIDDYVNYYYIAKYALNATPEELREINYPPLFTSFEGASEWAERIGAQRFRNARELREKIEKAITAATAEEREKARIEVENPVVQPTVKVPETFALLGSRDVYASVDGAQMNKGILPIQAFINDYMTRHHLTEQVTPRTVEKVIEGVNILAYTRNVKPANGVYRLETNISEFARLIGQSDTNQTEKLEILRALHVLDGLYLAVWRSDGLHAVRVLTVQEIGLTGAAAGALILNVNADAFKGRPNLISVTDFNDMRKAAKGQAENHFRYQIMSKGQKDEDALLNEVFGYDTLLKEIELSGGTRDEIAKAKKNIAGHKSRDRRRIATWFAEYKQNGWLQWSTREKGGKGQYVWKWKRTGKNPDEETSTPAVEQTK